MLPVELIRCWLWGSLLWLFWVGVNALEVALTSSLNAQEKLSWSWCSLLNAWCFLNEEFSLKLFLSFLLSSLNILSHLTTFHHLSLMNCSTLHFIRFEVNMTVVDRWKWKSSRWRPFPLFEEPRKIAVMAVSPMSSRLVTLGSRLLKKVHFWDCSVKVLVSGLESTRLWSRVNSWTKIFLAQFCT